MQEKRVAIVCDWIKDMGGAELVLSHLMELFPQAHIYTSVFWQKNNELFTNKILKTSFIQKIPIINRYHKLALFLRPFAFESFDFSQYDIVISSSSAESKGIITKPGTVHFCYCHTPTRYFWSHYYEYLSMMEFGFLNFLGKYCMPKTVHKLRQWDFVASKRVDYFIANSQNIKNRIGKYYKMDACIIHPGIDTSKFYLSEKKDFYLAVGRIIPYKKFDLIVETFNKNEKPLIIITSTVNKLQKKLQALSKENIVWKINISHELRNKYYSEAKGFLFPQEEDFGIVPIEAMASGTPVIAYHKGGATETVIDEITGIFFENQSVRSFYNAIERFEKIEFHPEIIRNHALNFDTKFFQQKLLDFITSKIQ